MRKMVLVLWFMGGICSFMFLSTPVAPAAAQYRNPAITDANSVVYWMDRGAMLATYGNHAAAIKAYRKALTLEPDHSAVYYNLGVSYGESQQLDEALAMMDKALSLEPGNAHYLYGRAWVLLRAGKVQQAQAEFAKAAQAGDQDARLYLQLQ